MKMNKKGGKRKGQEDKAVQNGPKPKKTKLDLVKFLIFYLEIPIFPGVGKVRWSGRIDVGSSGEQAPRHAQTAEEDREYER